MNKKEAKPSQLLKEQCGNAKKRLRRARRTKFGRIVKKWNYLFRPPSWLMPRSSCPFSSSLNAMQCEFISRADWVVGLKRSGLDDSCFWRTIAEKKAEIISSTKETSVGRGIGLTSAKNEFWAERVRLDGCPTTRVCRSFAIHLAPPLTCRFKKSTCV